MGSQQLRKKGRASNDKIAQLDRNNPIQGNRFEALSGDFVGAGGRGLVQTKVTAFASKRSLDEIDDGDCVSSPKRKAAPAGPSYAQKTADGGGGAGAALSQSVVMDSSWLANTDPSVSGGGPNLNENSSSVSNDGCSLSLSEEMNNLSDLLEKDGSPLNMALLIFLNKLNEGMDVKEKKIVSLEKEVKELKEKCREKELFVNRACAEKERSALRNTIDNSLKTLRIVGVERESKSNKEVLEETVMKLKKCSGDNEIDFSNTKLHTSKNGKFSTVNLTCHSLDQKLRIENNGRKAGVVFRQQLPSQLVGTCKDIREAYKKVASYQSGHLMVKLFNNRISISHRQGSDSRWALVENLQLPASKKMISLGCRQTLFSRVADLSKVFVPEQFC